MIEYRVDVQGPVTFAGTVRVTTATREEASAAAIAQIVTNAVAYNTKYGKSLHEHGFNYALRSTNPADYTATKVRKAPTRKAGR